MSKYFIHNFLIRFLSVKEIDSPINFSFFVEIQIHSNCLKQNIVPSANLWSVRTQITNPTKDYRPLFCILLTFTTAPQYLFTSQVIWEIFFVVVHIKMFVGKQKSIVIFTTNPMCANTKFILSKADLVGMVLAWNMFFVMTHHVRVKDNEQYFGKSICH